MFKHHRFENLVHAGRVGGTRPPVAPARPAAAPAAPAANDANAQAAAAFRQRACVVEGAPIDQATYVRQRMTDENVRSPQAKAAFEREFARYAGDDGKIDNTELARSMGDYQLSRADQATLTQPGITNRGAQVSANQAAINQWLQTPPGQLYAQQNPTLVQRGPNGQASITADGKEGPMTRSALAAMGRDTRASNADAEIRAIAGQNPPAAADALRLPSLYANIPEGNPLQAGSLQRANAATQAAIEGVASNDQLSPQERADTINKLAENFPENSPERTAAKEKAKEATERSFGDRLGTGLAETAFPPYAIANQIQRYASGQQGLASTLFNSVMSLVPGYSMTRNLIE